MSKPKQKKKEAKPSQWVEDAGKEERFSKVLSNPIYRRVPKKEKRVNIDKRFESMFHDKKFKLTYHMDKRGKPMETTTTENLQRLYNIEQDDEDDEAESEKATEEKPVSDQPSEDDATVEDHFEKPDTSKKQIKKLTEADRKKLHSAEIDYARGEGVFVSDESEDGDSSSAEEDETADVMHEWGELDRDAPTTEESTTRLALCNMDWDRVNAVDLMVLFSSFVPQGGSLKCVTIYPSEYGKQRLAEEELHGPKELVEDIDADSDGYESEDDGDEEGSRFNMEKLRKYQLNRLKYYYAVLEFDSISSAEKIYAECDRMEYESSATRVDLRFIPDDMTFDDEPKDKCDSNPAGAKYRPRFFTTSALQQAKVNLTWDETDPRRRELTEKIFNPKENIDDEDLRAYLASSPSESENEEETTNGQDEKDDIKDPILKYKALLNSIQDAERKKKDKDVELEITWGVGLKNKTEKLVQKKMEEQQNKNLTPWEEMLAKRREKRKNRKADQKISAGTEEGDESDEDEKDQDGQPFSDDDVDVDMSDAFFKDAFDDKEFKSKPKAQPKQKVKGKHAEPTEQEEQQQKELELLLMDEQADKKRHFSLKKIMEAEGDLTGKKKRKMKKKLKAKGQTATVPDDFNINLEDDRFSALYNSHQFNIDPSDPNYKKTNAMDKIITEKQKRRVVITRKDATETKKQKTTTDTADTESQSKKIEKSDVAFLVQSLKGRAKSWGNKNKKS